MESPLLKVGTFFSFQQIPFEQTAFLRRTITSENYTFSQKPTAHWIEKKTKTAPPPPPSPPQKYSALPSNPPHPFPYFFIWNNSQLMYSGVQECVCVCVCVCVCFQISPMKPLGQLRPNFMWNLHGIGEESLFKWSRSFVVLHYCQPLGGGGC